MGRGGIALEWPIIIYVLAHNNLDDGSCLRAERCW